MARKTAKGNAKQLNLGERIECTALYVRVSTDRQAEEGYSLDAQQERLQAFCTAQGWNVCDGHVYIDAGVSGKTADRPEFQRMLDAARTGEVQRIVAMKLDRLARNVRDFLNLVDDLKRWGCDLVLVKESFDTGTPQGKFALTMFAAMAELEAATITERVMSGKRQKAQVGGWNGAPRVTGYTYKGDGVFVVDEDEAGIVRTMFDLYTSGASLRAVARELTQQTGRTWHAAQVGYMLRNGFYAGLVQWDGVEAAGNHPAIIRRDQYEAVQARLS